MRLNDFIHQLNSWGRDRVPFLFLVDFELEKPLAWRMDQVDPGQLMFALNGVSNVDTKTSPDKEIHLDKSVLSLEEYEHKFSKVHRHILRGDSFLVNLTIKSGIEVNYSIRELYHVCQAKYKCWLRDQFLFFSPETFLQIRKGKIYSYPMKGTIDASVADARKIILENQKELAEHITIVDLIRNDMSTVAGKVKTARFRYVEEVAGHDKRLLQVSSEIVGDLPQHYLQRIGDILVAMMPPGSVSGAPKAKTCEIIREAEGEPRGYYTGVMGYFDGENVDSGVAIRFIEQVDDQLFYRSGGGITAQSCARNEYAEAVQKIYVPVT